MHAILEESDGWGKDILHKCFLQAKMLHHMPEKWYGGCYIPNPKDWFPKQGTCQMKKMISLGKWKTGNNLDSYKVEMEVICIVTV